MIPKFLEIVTENCEVFRFSSEDIIDVDLTVEGDSLYGKKLSRVRIHLKACANSMEADLTKYSYLSENKPILPFSRILHFPDITQISISEDFHCVVPWEDGKNDSENKLQHCSLDEDGNLIIEIGRTVK